MRGGQAAPRDKVHRVDDRDDSHATLEASPGDDSGSRPRALGGRLVVGELFAGRYLVEALIGRGGMGTVWRVRDEMVGETVALKALSLPPDGSARALERFRREVRLARRITSLHVARTHDLGSATVADEPLHFLTMEYVAGPSLGRVLEGDRLLAPERATRIAAQIAEGLAAAHGAGVVHRDLKPDNVLVESKTSRIVVTDFGIARALHDSDGANRTGGIVGTPLYMSPEQLAGAPVDERSDLYALGLVLFEMLTGTIAFDGETPIAAAVKRLHTPPRDPRELVAIPETLAELVLRCLERDPARRPPDAATLARLLAGYAGTGSMVSLDLASSSLRAQRPTNSTSASTPGTAVPVAPLLKAERALAVLPFAYRGAADQDWLAAGIGDELIDVLSRTRGLRVMGRGAALPHGGATGEGSRDPREVGRALGVDFVVDGTVQVGGPKLRVTIRLIEVGAGVQLWSERFESDVEDLFAVQERVAQRIAESLRVSLHSVGRAVPVPPEMLELYLRARARTRAANLSGPVEVVEMLERVIAQVPEFEPPYAAHAIACVRAWFLPRATVDRDWGDEAARSIERAMEHAPDLAETHYAKAQLESQHGRFREAVASVRTALQIAPTLPEAHNFLGSLQLEAGRAKEGLQRIDLALELEPTLTFALLEKARWHGLYGDLAVFERVLAHMAEDPSKDGFVAQQLIRVGAYRDDRAMLERGLELVHRSSHPAAPFLIVYARVMLGDAAAADELEVLLEVLNGPVSGRFRTLVHQMCSEGWGRLGDVERTMSHFRAGAESVLVDLEWVDRCPLLAPIRNHPELPVLRKVVRARCEAIWSY